MSNPNVAFTLRIRLTNRRPVVVPKSRRRTASLQERLAREEALAWNAEYAVVTIRVWDDQRSPDGRNRLDIEVRHGREVIFPKGQLYCGLQRGYTTDGIHARELVMAAIAMKPDDTDPDFFDGYTPAQLAWVETHGGALGCERQHRYCDENGEVRRSA